MMRSDINEKSFTIPLWINQARKNSILTFLTKKLIPQRWF